MTTKQILTEARNLVKQGWTQYQFAVDANGKDVDPTDCDAVEFCSLGAILAVTDGVAIIDHTTEEEDPSVHFLNWAVSECSDYESIWEFNDSNNVELSDILNVFDQAIYISEQ